MKFIGLPRPAKRSKMSFTGMIGAVLTISLAAVCTIGAISAITSRQSGLVETDSMLTNAGEIPVIATTLPMQANIPEIPDAAITIAETTPVNLELAAPVVQNIPDNENSSESEIAPISATSSAAEKTAGIVETPASGTYYATDAVNIRSGPGKDYQVVGSLAKNEAISVTASTDNGWKKIGDKKYVLTEFLSGNQPAAPTTAATTSPTTTAAPEETAHTGTYYVASDSMNVRSGPGLDYSVVKQLKKAAGIDVVAKTSNGWYKTVVGTYVKADLCTSTKPATPVETTPPTTTPPATPQETTKSNYLGSFRIVYYGPQLRPDGTYSTTTATGTTCQIGRTIAVDPSVIPLGTRIRINGLDIAGNGGYFTAEDTGGGVKGNMIDIYVSSEEEASRLNNGTYFDVYLAN